MARRKCIQKARNSDILERFALRSPAPAASRGGLDAREESFLGPPTEILTPTASSKIIVWADFALARRHGNLRRLFSTPIFRGMSPWAGRPGPAPGPARRAVDPGRARPRLHRAPPWTIGVGRAPPQKNQTSNQTSGGGLVSWPRLPRFA